MDYQIYFNKYVLPISDKIRTFQTLDNIKSKQKQMDYDIPEQTLGFLTRQNFVRKICIILFFSRFYFYFVNLSTFIFSMNILYDYLIGFQTKQFIIIISIIQIAIELFIHIIVKGFISSPNSTIKHIDNWVNILIFLFVCIQLKTYKSLFLIKLIMLFHKILQTYQIITSLKSSFIKKLGIIISNNLLFLKALLIYFMVIYIMAILLKFSYSTKEKRNIYRTFIEAMAFSNRGFKIQVQSKAEYLWMIAHFIIMMVILSMISVVLIMHFLQKKKEKTNIEGWFYLYDLNKPGLKLITNQKFKKYEWKYQQILQNERV